MLRKQQISKVLLFFLFAVGLFGLFYKLDVILNIKKLEVQQETICYVAPDKVIHSVLNAVNRNSLFSAIAKALPHLTADHPDFVYITQKYILEPPAPRSQLKLTSPNKKHYSQFRQDEAVDKLLNRMTNGFFIEAGAYNGESFSNSLFFEKERNWTGLLVEPLPIRYNQLRYKHRHAFSANVCLGTENRPYTTMFSNREMFSAILTGESKQNDSMEVLCAPLFTLLKAIGQKRIDYFTLDIESLEIELAVLKNLPWGQIEFGIIDVEFNADKKNMKILREFMKEKGFVEVVLDVIDSFFMNKSLVPANMPIRLNISQILNL